LAASAAGVDPLRRPDLTFIKTPELIPIRIDRSGNDLSEKCSLIIHRAISRKAWPGGINIAPSPIITFLVAVGLHSSFFQLFGLLF